MVISFRVVMKFFYPRMDLDLTFLRYMQNVQDAIGGTDGELPPTYNSDWDMFLLRVDQPMPGRDPDTYQLVSPGELQNLSPRLFKAAQVISILNADRYALKVGFPQIIELVLSPIQVYPVPKPFLYETLRKKKYYVSSHSFHPLKQEAKTIQLFSLVASSEFNFITQFGLQFQCPLFN